jgi:hypothetical protein
MWQPKRYLVNYISLSPQDFVSREKTKKKVNYNYFCIKNYLINPDVNF